MYEWEALVTRNLHAKYKGSISNGSKVRTNVKVVQLTNQQIDRAKTICPRFTTGDIKRAQVYDRDNYLQCPKDSNSKSM